MENIKRKLAVGNGESSGREFVVNQAGVDIKIIANTPEHAWSRLVNETFENITEEHKKILRNKLRETYGGWEKIRKAARRAAPNNQ